MGQLKMVVISAKLAGEYFSIVLKKVINEFIFRVKINRGRVQSARKIENGEQKKQEVKLETNRVGSRQY